MNYLLALLLALALGGAFAQADAQDPPRPAGSAKEPGPIGPPLEEAGLGLQAPGVLPEPKFIEVFPQEPRADSFFVGLAGAAETETLIGDEALRVPIRLVGGFPRVYNHFGVRAMVDYARQSPLFDGALAAATLVAYRLDFGYLSAYAGAGAGWQFNTMNLPQATEGPFVSSLLGAEYFLTRSLGVFLEGTLDVYFDAPEPTAELDPYDYGRLYTTFGLGLAYHF